MTIQQALNLASQKLTATSASPELDAEVLLTWAINKSKEYLAANPAEELSADQQEKFQQALSQRQTGLPVAYITNTKEFFGYDFYIDQRVLIPRPETESLVEQVLALARPGDTIADVGTGSSCIACSLALTNDKLTILASDISADALAVAQENINRLKASVKLFQGDLLMPLAGIKLDIIVANLPYVDKNRLDTNNQRSAGLRFEPALALFGGSFGIETYTKFFEQIAALESLPRHVLIEIDPYQADQLIDLIKQLFPTTHSQIKKDLAGLPRVVQTDF